MTLLDSPCFSSEALAPLIAERLPRHVAIIMDGNRRWGQKMHFNSKPPDLAEGPISGHWAGADTLLRIVQAAIEIGISTLTVYGLSTENRARSATEIDLLFRIFETYLTNYRDKMVAQGVQFHTIGNPTPLPSTLEKIIKETKEATANCQKINLVVAINYGSRDEIRRSFIAMHEKMKKERLTSEAITENFISKHLDTAPFGDPDLLIRTSGELRISNFLLWQLAYAEIYTTDTLWPDFKPHDLLNATLAFQKRARRIGR